MKTLTQRDRILELMSDGRIARRVDLVEQGFSQGVIGRMVLAGELETVGSAGLRMPGSGDDPLLPLAAAFGRRGGVLTLQAAAALHGITDETGEQFPPTVLLPVGAYAGDSGLDVRIVRTSKPLAFELGVSERTFGGSRLKVADPARTLCDMFAPWARSMVVEDADRDAMMRVLADPRMGVPVLQRAMNHAHRLGWGRRMGEMGQTAIGMRNWMGGVGP